MRRPVERFEVNIPPPRPPAAIEPIDTGPERGWGAVVIAGVVGLWWGRAELAALVGLTPASLTPWGDIAAFIGVFAGVALLLRDGRLGHIPSAAAAVAFFLAMPVLDELGPDAPRPGEESHLEAHLEGLSAALIEPAAGPGAPGGIERWLGLAPADGKGAAEAEPLFLERAGDGRFYVDVRINGADLTMRLDETAERSRLGALDLLATGLTVDETGDPLVLPELAIGPELGIGDTVLREVPVEVGSRIDQDSVIGRDLIDRFAAFEPGRERLRLAVR